MTKRIAVEDNLGNIRDYLSNQGYEITNLSKDRNNLKNYDAIIVSGQDKDFMGIDDTLTKAQVIDATGKTPEDIYAHLKNTLS